MRSAKQEDFDALNLAWRAIVVVDVVESVRLMHADEVDVIRRWRRFVREVRDHVLPPHRGRMAKSLGDGMLLEFECVPVALDAAFAIQDRLANYNAEYPSDCALALRIGAHAAEVVVDEIDLFGKGVNLAFRLVGLVEPGQIAASDIFVERLVAGVDADFEDLGACFVKHLEVPVHAYRLVRPGKLVHQGVEPGSYGHGVLATAQIGGAEPTIAVLPFDLWPAAGAAAAIGELLADSLTTRLALAPSVRVISRLSCQAIGGRALGASVVGRLLNADYVVSGRCSGSPEKLVVHVELARTEDAQIVWTERVRTSLDELLEVDDDFSAHVSSALISALSEAELRRALTHPLPHLQGFTLLRSATQLMHRSSTREFAHSRAMLDHLADRYPRAASPQAWLADWHVLSVTKGFAKASPDLAARALDHTRRALDADPDCALALAIQGFVHCHVQGDLDLAERRLEQALRANPSEPLAWLFRCVVHGFRGEGERAWHAAQRALALSPLDPQKHYFQSLAASAALAAQRYGDAITLAESSLRINRSHLPTLRALTIAQLENGDVGAARDSARRILEFAPGFTVADYVAGGPKGAEGARRRYARALREAGLP